MQPALRPMSTSQVLDRTFHLYRNHFPLLAGIGVLLPALLLVLRMGFVPLGYPPRGAALRDPFLIWTIVLEYMGSSLLLYIIGHAITGGATVYAVSRLHLGEPITIAEAYRKTLPRFWSIVRIALTIYVRLVGSGILTVIACLLVTYGADALLAFLGTGMNNAVATVTSIVTILTALAGIFWMLYSIAWRSLPAWQKICPRGRRCAAAGSLPARASGALL